MSCQLVISLRSLSFSNGVIASLNPLNNDNAVCRSCEFIYKAITSSCSCINVSSVVCSCALYIERKLEFSTGKRLSFLINLLNSDCICEESLIISVLTRIRRSTITKNWLYSNSVLITSTVDCCCVSNNTRISDNELSAVLVKVIASFSFFAQLIVSLPSANCCVSIGVPSTVMALTVMLVRESAAGASLISLSEQNLDLMFNLSF